MSEITYDAEMVAAFLEPRRGESVPAQYAHDLAHMAFNEHEQALRAQAQVKNWEMWANNLPSREDDR